MKKIILFLICGFVLNVHAENKTFIREYYYQAGENDSKVTARFKALSEVKRLLLEELGVYMESYTNYIIEDQSGTVTKDFFQNEIKSLSAGITKTKILKEVWNGVEYYIKAEIVADPTDVARKINATLEKRKADGVIDSLKQTLLDAQAISIKRDKEIESLHGYLFEQKKIVQSQQYTVSRLNTQLQELNTQLSHYQQQEKLLLSDIQRIENIIKTTTNNAISNARRGMTPNEVVQVCGQPRSTSVFMKTLYYNYGTVWLIFQDNILLKGISHNNYGGAYNANWYDSTPNILN